MNEIEKLYENAGVSKEVIPCPAEYYGYNCTRNNWDDADCSCDLEGYPPFTSEKQLELLKLCFDKYEKLEKVRGLKERCIIYYRFDKNGYTEFVNCETWEETIAGLVNNLWQDLTEEEKEQVKGILKA